MDVLKTEPREYDPVEGEKLASWCFSLYEHAREEKHKKADPQRWIKTWRFIRGEQWEGEFPSYRRPIVHNVWRRILHILLAVIVGERPVIKIVPQGRVNPNDIQVIQNAFWSIWENEHIGDVKYPACWLWALVCNGGWMKIGYGRRNPFAPELPDVIVKTVHPAKIYTDPECTDVTLTECSYIIYREVLDLPEISKRYPEQSKYVQPEEEASWADEPLPDHQSGPFTITPAGGWIESRGRYRRARCTVLEVWIDDPTLELQYREIESGIDVNTGLPYRRTEPVWVPKYPYGRLITCTRNVVLRDIPNPYGPFLGWENRWPFVYLPGSFDVDPLWASGILSTMEEEQKAINRAMQLLVENAIKFSSGYVICDEGAIEPDEWRALALMPGIKIKKQPGLDFKIQWPPPMPQHMFSMPDYFATKMEQEVGLHDPPLAPGQAVAAKTVEFLQRKGNYLLGLLAKNGDAFLERLGVRIIGLMLGFYERGRPIPYFNADTYEVSVMEWPSDIPRSMRFRVEATSAWLEILATLHKQAIAESALQRRGRR